MQLVASCIFGQFILLSSFVGHHLKTLQFLWIFNAMSVTSDIFCPQYRCIGHILFPQLDWIKEWKDYQWKLKLCHTLNLNGNWHFSFILVRFSSSWITSHFFSTLSHKMRRICAKKYDLLTIDIVEPSPDTSNGDHINIIVIWNSRKLHGLREKGLHSSFIHSSRIMITHSGQTLPRIHKHELTIIQAATAVIPVLVNLLCLCSCNAGDALALAPTIM